LNFRDYLVYRKPLSVFSRRRNDAHFAFGGFQNVRFKRKQSAGHAHYKNKNSGENARREMQPKDEFSKTLHNSKKVLKA